MAEWLGTALQKLLQRFDSASHLKKVGSLKASLYFFEVRVLAHCTTQRQQVSIKGRLGNLRSLKNLGRVRRVPKLPKLPTLPTLPKLPKTTIESSSILLSLVYHFEF